MHPFSRKRRNPANLTTRRLTDQEKHDLQVQIDQQRAARLLGGISRNDSLEAANEAAKRIGH